jgi:hypothetical protein
MNTKENEVIRELSLIYNKKEIVIRIMYEKARKHGDNIEGFRELLEKFYLSKTCPK